MYLLGDDTAVWLSPVQFFCCDSMIELIVCVVDGLYVCPEVAWLLFSWLFFCWSTNPVWLGRLCIFLGFSVILVNALLIPLANSQSVFPDLYVMVVEGLFTYRSNLFTHLATHPKVLPSSLPHLSVRPFLSFLS